MCSKLRPSAHLPSNLIISNQILNPGSEASGPWKSQVPGPELISQHFLSISGGPTPSRGSAHRREDQDGFVFFSQRCVRSTGLDRRSPPLIIHAGKTRRGAGGGARRNLSSEETLRWVRAEATPTYDLLQLLRDIRRGEEGTGLLAKVSLGSPSATSQEGVPPPPPSSAPSASLPPPPR